VGETRACGTGTVAAVAASLHLAGTDTGSSTVDIPGGVVTVTVARGASTLTGPAEIVARGELDETWWAVADRHPLSGGHGGQPTP
jgi:diaminopimelate epimerase